MTIGPTASKFPLKILKSSIIVDHLALITNRPKTMSNISINDDNDKPRSRRFLLLLILIVGT
jgi:hypothetical protein